MYCCLYWSLFKTPIPNMRVKTPERVTRSLWLRDKVCGRKGKSKTLQWHIKDIFPSVNKVVTTWVLQIIPDTLQGKISVGDAQWRCLPSAYLCLLVRLSLWARLWRLTPVVSWKCVDQRCCVQELTVVTWVPTATFIRQSLQLTSLTVSGSLLALGLNPK